MNFPISPEYGGGARDGIRITIGTDAEIDTLLENIRQVV